MPLFEVAFVEKLENAEVLVYGPEPVIAETRDAAIVLATKRAVENDVLPEVSLEKFEVLVRPFA